MILGIFLSENEEEGDEGSEGGKMFSCAFSHHENEEEGDEGSEGGEMFSCAFSHHENEEDEMHDHKKALNSSFY